MKRDRTLGPKLGELAGKASNGGPARPVGVITGEAPVVASRWWCRVAARSAARGRPDTPERVGGGLGTCRATATCVRAPTPGEPPGDRRDRSSAPACGPTSGAVHGTPAGRTRESATKLLLRDHAPQPRRPGHTRESKPCFPLRDHAPQPRRPGHTRESELHVLLRDHAPPQPRGPSVVGARIGHANGAHVATRRAGLWPLRSGAVCPAAAPPASGGPAAGIPGLGSNAGSNAAAGTCARSLCVGRFVRAVVAHWHSDGTWD